MLLIAFFVFILCLSHHHFLEYFILKCQIRDSSLVKSVAKDILSQCAEEYKEYPEFMSYCYYYKTLSFIEQKVEKREDSLFEDLFYLKNDPEYTLKYGGDCDGKLVLAVAILRELGFKDIYFVFQKHHSCLLLLETEKYTVEEDGKNRTIEGKQFRFFGCDEKLPIEYIRKI